MKLRRPSAKQPACYGPLARFATCAVLVSTLIFAPLGTASAQTQRCFSFDTAVKYECQLGGANPMKSAFDCLSNMFSISHTLSKGRRVGTDKVTRLVKNDTEVFRVDLGEFDIKTDLVLRVRNIDKTGVEFELLLSKPVLEYGKSLPMNDQIEERTIFRVNYDGSKTKGFPAVESLGIEKITAVPERNGMAKLTLHYPRLCY